VTRRAGRWTVYAGSCPKLQSGPAFQ